MLVGAATWLLIPPDPIRLRHLAESATRAGDHAGALRDWRALNRTRHATGPSHLAEARACLALGLAAQAEHALARACLADPSDPAPWLIRLELLRVEDRPLEAIEIGREAAEAVPPASRREVLRGLTLALLADPPAEEARSALSRWSAADPDDLDARVAQLGRIAADPRPGDPDRAARIATLSDLLIRHPAHAGVREALVIALADAGEPDRGRALLDAWPDRDPRYERLRGRWDLDYDRRPDAAVAAFRLALTPLPHDWKTRFRLARALRAAGHPAEAAVAAEAVARTREALDPATLGPVLLTLAARPDDSRACLDVADHCERAGLARLAEAWRVEAASRRVAP